MQMAELGFVEKPEDPNELTSAFYPSKVGGKPAWLDLTRIPALDTLTCKKCEKPLVSLLQFQAPLPSQEEDYRALFLFMCMDPKCHSPGYSGCFVVLRCELREREMEGAVDNSHTITESLLALEVTCTSSCDTKDKRCDKELTTPNSSRGSGDEHDNSALSLCIVCGGCGPMKCSSCRCVNYCSRYHQIHDWKLGHKEFCSKMTQGKTRIDSISYNPSVGVVLPELEIVTEDEPEICRKTKPECSEEKRMEDYVKYLEKKGHVKSEYSVESLEKAVAGETKKDKVFKAFRKRIASEPQQVLRYERGGRPLFVSGNRVPTTADIPRCTCGAERQFELQVLPQLLYYLNLDSASPSEHSIDWGTLLVYTCSSDRCNLGPGYHKEFLWKQEIQ